MMGDQMLRAVLVGITIAAGFALAPRFARAQSAAEPGTRGTVVLLGELGQGVGTRPVIRAVEGQLADLDVRLHVVWVEALAPRLPDQITHAEAIAHEVGALAVFWCELGRSDRIYLYFAAPRGGRMVVRELTGSGSGGAAEALAIIVRSSVEAVLAGAEIGEVVAPAPTDRTGRADAAPAPTGEGAPRPRRLLAFETAYQLDIRSTADPAEHGVHLGLRLALGPRWSCGLGYGVAFPTVSRAHGAELELRRHPVGAWVGLRFEVGAVRLGLSLGLQLDPVTERVVAGRPGVAVDDGGTTVIVSVLPTVGLGYAFGDRVQLFARFGVDVPFNDVRWVLEGPDGPLVVRDDWPVRPRSTVGLSVDLW